MNDSSETTMNSGYLAEPGISQAGTVLRHESAAPERRDPSARVFLSKKLGVANFGAATRFHSVKSARALFTSSFIPAPDSALKTIWHASCFTPAGASSFRRWSAGQEIPSCGRRTAFPEYWTAPMAGRFPHISNQPTIK